MRTKPLSIIFEEFLETKRAEERPGLRNMTMQHKIAMMEQQNYYRVPNSNNGMVYQQQGQQQQQQQTMNTGPMSQSIPDDNSKKKLQLEQIRASFPKTIENVAFRVAKLALASAEQPKSGVVYLDRKALEAAVSTGLANHAVLAYVYDEEDPSLRLSLCDALVAGLKHFLDENSEMVAKEIKDQAKVWMVNLQKEAQKEAAQQQQLNAIEQKLTRLNDRIDNQQPSVVHINQQGPQQGKSESLATKFNAASKVYEGMQRFGMLDFM
jgi:uncharacterized membrane-anchored protein YjiN (DUF445 family)